VGRAVWWRNIFILNEVTRRHRQYFNGFYHPLHYWEQIIKLQLGGFIFHIHLRCQEHHPILSSSTVLTVTSAACSIISMICQNFTWLISTRKYRKIRFWNKPETQTWPEVVGSQQQPPSQLNHGLPLRFKGLQPYSNKVFQSFVKKISLIQTFTRLKYKYKV
jgi:hypothetical protein